jgi:tRNA threonylcarbamoyladenosine biosynthesis protein TsaB
MKLLALETATEACSVALWLDGTCHERYQLAARAHADLILPMAEDLLDESGLTLQALDAVAFGRGPGAFTGVRIAAAVAQALAFAAELPVVPVSTLAVLAQGGLRVHPGEQRILAMLDARMGELYWAECVAHAGRVQHCGSETVAPPEQVPEPAPGRWLAVGNGWLAHGKALTARFASTLTLHWVEQPDFPRARDLADLAASALAAGEGVDPAAAQPVYLRDRVAVASRS